MANALTIHNWPYIIIIIIKSNKDKGAFITENIFLKLIDELI